VLLNGIFGNEIRKQRDFYLALKMTKIELPNLLLLFSGNGARLMILKSFKNINKNETN